MDKNYLNELELLLSKNDKYIVEEKLNKNKVAELAHKYDPELIDLLASKDSMRKLFFVETKKNVLVFNKDKFIHFISNKEFLPDSFTAYKNKIGLASGTDLLSKNKEVVLSWAYKDCVLEGGQDKEDAKRNEVFHNEVLAPDQIDRLLDEKVMTGFKRYDKDGEHEVKNISDDDNLVIRGNNLLALHSLKKHYAGKVKLIYIDPPFNTGNDSFNYNDRFGHSTWLTFMKNRLEVAKDLLSNDGNIFVHLDHNESHYLKVLMDEVFGRSNFVQEIIWSYGTASGGRAAGAKPVNIHDYILNYAKKYESRKQNKLHTPYSEKYLEEWFKYTDNDGRQYRRRMQGNDDQGNSVWSKQYLDESKGVPLTTVWSDIKQVYADPRAYKENMASSTEIVKGFNGQKPEQLLKRILEMSTDEGDLVLDYHLGTGTTAVVSHKMNRRYIGIEQLDYGKTDAVSRLQRTIGSDTAGISKDVDWSGGGSFIYTHLMDLGNKFIQKVKKSSTDKELVQLLEQAKKSSFLSYKVDPEKINPGDKDFTNLSIAHKKQLLLELVDQNHLYVNYSEIDDSDYDVSTDDKKINKQFYGN